MRAPIVGGDGRPSIIIHAGGPVLQTADLVAFAPTREPQRARAFYEGLLGLELVSEDPFALVFNANGVTLRIANVSSVQSYQPAPFTILGWRVPSAESAARDLASKGIVCERFAGLEQSPLGIWTAPGGAKIAWFKDPDGNILSIAET